MHLTTKKVVITIIGFTMAFALIMLLFIKKPDIVKSKNKALRAAMVFSIAFVPGVMAASICAAIVLKLHRRLSGSFDGVLIESEQDSSDNAA